MLLSMAQLKAPSSRSTESFKTSRLSCKTSLRKPEFISGMPHEEMQLDHASSFSLQVQVFTPKNSHACNREALVGWRPLG